MKTSRSIKSLAAAAGFAIAATSAPAGAEDPTGGLRPDADAAATALPVVLAAQIRRNQADRDPRLPGDLRQRYPLVAFLACFHLGSAAQVPQHAAVFRIFNK